jgi:hypothetical protein
MFHTVLLTPEKTERFIETQAFLRSCDDSAPRPSPPSPLSRQQIVSLSQFSCVSPIWGGGGVEGAVKCSRIIRPQKSLALYKLFNPLCASSVNYVIVFLILSYFPHGNCRTSLNRFSKDFPILFY